MRWRLEAGHLFTYKTVRQNIDYQNENFYNLIGYIESSKGEHIIFLHEYELVLPSCVPVELGFA